MTLQALIILVVIGGIAGWMASFALTSGFGLIGNVIAGVVGSFLGSWLIVDVLKLKLTGVVLLDLGKGWVFGLDQLICAIIGALILVVALKLIKKA